MGYGGEAVRDGYGYSADGVTNYISFSLELHHSKFYVCLVLWVKELHVI